MEFSPEGGAAGAAAGLAAQRALAKRAAARAAATQAAKVGATRAVIGIGGRLAAGLVGGPVGIAIALGSIIIPTLLSGNKKTEEVADTTAKGLKLDEKTSKAQADFWNQIEGDNSDAAKQRNEQIRKSNKLIELTRGAQEQERNTVNSRLLAELGKQALALNAIAEMTEQGNQTREELLPAFERAPLRPQLVDPSFSTDTSRGG